MAVYTIAFLALRAVSYPHWVLFAGLRLCALVLFPRRDWPALVVGDCLPLLDRAWDCWGELGIRWAMIMLFPPILLDMPVVILCKEKLGLLRSKTEFNIPVLVLAMILVAIAGTAINSLSLSLTILPPNYVIHWPRVLANWAIGNFIGALTIVPLAMCVREGLNSAPPGERFRRLGENRLMLEGLPLLLPSLALLVWLSLKSGDDTTARQAAQMAMFLPVIILAVRHGWHGAAVGGAAASIAVVVSVANPEAATTFEAQVFIALTASSMLLLGGRITTLRRREEADQEALRMRLAVAHNSVYMSEMQLRRVAAALDQVREHVSLGYAQLLGEAVPVIAASERTRLTRHALAAQNQLSQLSDSLYPVSWRERGLPAALSDGTLARGLEDNGIAFECDLQGQGLSRLSPSIHIAIYRMVCESVSYLCAEGPVQRIHVRMRGGVRDGRRWVFLSVKGERPSVHAANDAVAGQFGRRQRMDLVASTGLGLEAIQHHAMVFEGRMKRYRRRQGESIAVLLQDS